MRTPGLGRFLVALGVVFASAIASSCDSPNASQSAANGQIRVPIPSLSAHRGLAAQNSADPLEPSKIRVRIVLARTGEVLLDRSFDENDPAVNDQTEPTTITIKFQYPAGAEADAFTVDLSAFNTSNVELMHVGPLTFHLGADGRSANVEGTIQWVGPGRDVTSVVISPRSISVAVGATSPISCVGNPGGLTVFPFEMSSSNSAVANVSGRGNVVTGVSPGTAQVFCELFTNGATDVIPVTVTAAGTQGISLVSGGGQTAAPGAQLPIPIKVLVRGAGGGILANTQVQFQPQAGSGSVNPSTANTGADGTVQTNWTLGPNPGTHTLIVTVNNPGMTLNVTATAVAPPQTGVSGTIRNGQGAALSGMVVELRSGSNNTSGAALLSSTTGAPGTYSFTSLTPGVFTVLVSGSGFTTQSQNVTVTNGVLATLDFTMQAATTGEVAGTVRDAVTANPLSGVTVRVRAGFGNTTGTILGSTTTNASGVFTLTGITAGAATVQAVLTGFADATANVTIVAGNTVPANIPMSPTLTAGQVRIVVTWTDASLDLDSRLQEPGGQLVFYAANNAELGCTVTVNPFACLQHDALSNDPFGQNETTLIGTVKAGTYFFHVYNFSSNGSASGALSASGAAVDVYFGASQTAAFHFTVPVGTGTEWRVFQLAGSTPGSLTPVNDLITVNHPLGSLRDGSSAGVTKKERR